jgi:hypothetical protein
MFIHYLVYGTSYIVSVKRGKEQISSFVKTAS